MSPTQKSRPTDDRPWVASIERLQRESAKMLPNFLIVGAMRAGTTSMYRYLADHPDIAFATTKEVHFFDGRFDRGTEWYESCFAGCSGRAVGEATPNYCYDEQAAERIAVTLPDARLVMMVRDPADRAYSHYWHTRARGKESLDLEDALDAEPARIGGNQYQRADFSYVDRGRYLNQIERMLGFFDREQIKVVLFADLVAAPDRVYSEVCQFLGVDDSYRPANLGEVINPYVTFRSMKARRVVRRLPGKAKRLLNPLLVDKSRSYPPLSKEVRRRLVATLEYDITRFEDFLDRDLSAWRQV